MAKSKDDKSRIKLIWGLTDSLSSGSLKDLKIIQENLTTNVDELKEIDIINVDNNQQSMQLIDDVSFITDNITNIVQKVEEMKVWMQLVL